MSAAPPGGRRWLKTLRARGPTLLIDSGDTTTRGPLATQYEGRDEIAAMNALGYDLAAIGNNEFKLLDAEDAHDSAGAQDSLRKLVAASRFPWICANATRADGSPLPGGKPFIVRRIGKIRVAFLGLTTSRSARYPQTKGLKITDPVDAAKLWIPRARAEADVVVAVTHIGVLGDVRLVRSTSGIDAVVGGDSHTYLYKPIEEKNAAGVGRPHRAGWRVRREAGRVSPEVRGRRGLGLAPGQLRRCSGGRGCDHSARPEKSPRSWSATLPP